jgi:hypothetical protein
MIWTPQNRDGLLVADVSRPVGPPQIEEVCMTRPHITIVLALSLTAVTPSRSSGQQAAPAKETYWTVAYYQVDWPKVDSLTKLFRAYQLPVVDEVKKSGGLLDYRMLIHDMAGRDNVVIMEKFSFAAIHDNDANFQAAIRRVQPDSIKRKAVLDGFGYIFGAGLHRDEIYTEVTKE